MLFLSKGYKDMHLSSPARTPKLQLAAEQPLTGQCCSTPPLPQTKHTQVQGQRGSPNSTVGGVSPCLESNLIPTRDAQRGQTKPLCIPAPRERSSDLQKLSQTCLGVFECLLQRQGLAVACCRDRGSGFKAWEARHVAKVLLE